MKVEYIIGIYGALSIIAAIAQGKYNNIPKKSALLMGIGGLVMISSMFLTDTFAIITFALGAIAVHISAIINGTRLYGKINKKHHIIRFIVTIILILALVLEQNI